MKIPESKLFEIGWRRFGDHEDDPFYRFHSSTTVLNTSVISGNYTDTGEFEIYGVPVLFHSIVGLSAWIETVGFVSDKSIIDRYGSSDPLR